MERADLIGIAGGLFLLLAAYFDAGWRWFWATAGVLILLWSLWTIGGPRRVD